MTLMGVVVKIFSSVSEELRAAQRFPLLRVLRVSVCAALPRPRADVTFFRSLGGTARQRSVIS
jgi:hypothetical protein